MSIREAVPADVPAMLAIYAEYVTQTAVSFEYEVPSEAEFTRRLTEHTAVYPWLVWEEDGRVLGYCYAGRAFERAAYAWNAEISCYLAHEAQHRGIGRQLYARVEELLCRQGLPKGLRRRHIRKRAVSRIPPLHRLPRCRPFPAGRLQIRPVVRRDLAGKVPGARRASRLNFRSHGRRSCDHAAGYRAPYISR